MMTNAQIAGVLLRIAQLLSTNSENLYRKKAYQRAAATLRMLGASVDDMVRNGEDLTQYPGIGKGMSGAIEEIVHTGTLRKLATLREQITPELAALNEYPRLDPRRVLRVYKKLDISSPEALREKLESGEIKRALGARMESHIRAGLVDPNRMLLYKADALCEAVQQYLVDRCKVRRAQVAGEVRRRVEVVDRLVFVVPSDNFAALAAPLASYGGSSPIIASGTNFVSVDLPAGLPLEVHGATDRTWGVAMIRHTGSERHLQELATAGMDLDALERSGGEYPTEDAVYRTSKLPFIDPEIREGHGEVERGLRNELRPLVTVDNIRGDLHMHTSASDGVNSVEQMASAAADLGYEYVGITDHSQSLKIAGGVSPNDLREQMGHIDRLNASGKYIRILKSAEVDILADGSLDYPDDLLRELDYTVCSIHSRFGMGRAEQTERIMRAMDHPSFTILGHATGRLLLKRPGYEIDIERLIRHARERAVFFEINCSPDRLDLSAENVRKAAEFDVKIAVSTDAHSTRELALIRYGIDQARRAGLNPASVLNCLPVDRLLTVIQR